MLWTVVALDSELVAPKRVSVSGWRMDATTLTDRFTVLCISVLYRGCAIPVAWKILRAGEKGAWEPHWKALLTSLKGAVPKHWTVIVLADRGLYAPWLFHHIVGLGWHPFLRINLGGKVRPVGAERFDWLRSLVPTTGSAWCGLVDCFVEKTVRATLLARWDEGYADPWLILTDLAPESADVVWYGMRTWIEGGFKDTCAWRRALAPNQDDRSCTRQSLMVSHCRGDLVGGQCRGGSRCDPILQRIGRPPRTTYRPTQDHQAVASSAPELLCPGSATDFRGEARRDGDCR